MAFSDFVKIEIEKTGTGFSASSPDVPGCGATGRTEEEARTRMEQAIAFHLEDPEAAAQVKALRASRARRKRASASADGPAARGASPSLAAKGRR